VKEVMVKRWETQATICGERSLVTKVTKNHEWAHFSLSKKGFTVSGRNNL